jgi:serine-threonine kinase receptor-associated protein
MAEEKEKTDDNLIGPIICLGHSKPIPYLHYSSITPDGYFLISACIDKKPMLREGITGDWIGSFLGHKGAVWSARLNHDATLAVTAAGDFSSKLWNSITGEEIFSLSHNHVVKTGCFSADSRVVLTGGKEKKVRIFDVRNPSADPTVLVLGAPIQQILATSDPNLMVCCGEEKGISVIDLRTAQVERVLDTPAPVKYLSLSADQRILSCTSGNNLLFFDATTFSLNKSFATPQESLCVAYHPQSGKILTGCETDELCHVYDYSSEQEIATNKGHHAAVVCVDFAPDGSAYATGSNDGTVRIWDERAVNTAQ